MDNQKNKKFRPISIQRTSLLALLAALSLIIFAVESLVPPLVPLPGVKLGLANVVTLFLVLKADKRSAFEVLIVRTVLSAVFAGQAISFIYSLCGGILAMLAMLAANRILGGRPVWFISAVGGVFHNVGQMAAACVMLSAAALAYLPHLLISGCVTGVLTGILTDLAVSKMEKAGVIGKINSILSSKKTHERKDR